MRRVELRARPAAGRERQFLRVGVRRVIAAGVVVVLMAGASGCRQRAADRGRTSVPPVVGSSSAPAAPSSSSSAISQQDLDNLNGILSTVGGAASSVRSAIAGDGSQG